MKTLLTISQLYKSYGSRIIFDDINLGIAEKQKTALIGRNGCGKSTLVKIIVGDEEATSGTVSIHDGTRIGYLTQHDPFETDETVMEFLQRTTQKQEWECAKMAGQFDIKNEQLHRSIGSFAGGYQMRIKLIELLLHDPNLLLLDEPTNYLDLSTLLLLEQFLQSYQGSFVVISHDREFIRNTATSVLEIEHGQAFFYPQPLDTYLAYKDEQLQMKQKYNKKIEREKGHLQAFVDRFRYKASKASQAQSKLKQIERLKTVDIHDPLSTSRIQIPHIVDKKGTSLEIEDMTIGYPDKDVATNINFDISRGEHIAIVGDNGQGKTTLLKTIAGELDARDGNFRWGPDMSIGYYAQHVPQMLKERDTVESYLASRAKNLLTQEDILRMAGNFLFQNDDLKKTVRVLSGGEKARLCLAGLLLQKHDVLLLDEPTNHLDFETVESLARALSACNTTILFISHNRTFVNEIATGIIEVADGKVKRYLHDYENYVYHIRRHMHVTPTVSTKKMSDETKIERKKRYDDQRKKQKEIRSIEHTLMVLEREKQTLLSWFEKNHSTYNAEKTEQLQIIQADIDKHEQEWIKLQDEIEA